MQEDKLRRQSALRALLQKKAFRSQQAIVQEMKQLGFSVTQPSISRDFRDIGVIKARGRYTAPAGTEVSERSATVRSMEAVGNNLVVVRTDTGAAGIIALEIDKLEIEGVVGTVAGDDTVFIATRNKRAQERVTLMLSNRESAI